jgi:hypothetical protein
MKQFLPILPILLFLLLLTGCSPSEQSFEPKNIYDCNRTYYETAYETTWISTESASLDYNRWSGKITFTPPSTKKNTTGIAWGMDTDKFFEHCSTGNIGVWSTACSHFQQCVSVVKNIEIPNQEEFVSLDFKEAAEFIKQKLYSVGKTEPRRNCFNGRCSMPVDNITNSCDVVQRTYSATTVGDSIFKNIPELDYEQSQALGVKAVEGYGECLCALHDFLNIKDDYSIGYCIGDNYFDCERGEGAFCGRNIQR